MSHRERRLEPRIQPFVQRCVALAGDRRIPGYVTDLSARGARIISPEKPPPVGTPVILEMAFRRPERRVRIMGSMKWAHSQRDKKDFVFGLAFVDLKREDEELLARVIADFAERAARLGSASATGREG
ncbi:MAG: PilZ domain-containing protein [Vicinamibacteria bacterium]|nr:PilZ domain-containing protein [Vicinamibacteria bacterium]